MRCLTAGIVLCLANLSSGAAGAEPMPGKQVEQAYESDDGSLAYLLYLPKQYESDASGSDKRLPLIFFLHGRGESYGPLRLVEKWGPPRMAARGDHLPYVVVSPQCPGTSDWRKPEQQELLIQLLDHVIETLRIDKQRIYLTGLSMGGYGCWHLAAAHPHRFAAVAPICGGGDPASADRLKALPIWVFHGDQDKAVPIGKSNEMVEAIRSAGSEVLRYTTLEDVGHNCWSAAYATPGLYEWFNQQSRGRNQERGVP